MSRTIEEQAREVAERGASTPRFARDPVNRAMINNWVEAIGDTNPRYTDPDDPVAPPAMAQVWSMAGLHGARATDDPLGAMIAIMDDAGFTSVVATDSEQNYYRHLTLGEHVSSSIALEDVTGPKRTALGEGWFVTTRSTWRVGDEIVADMRFRVLKFRPKEATPAPDPAAVLRPVSSKDTEFFWEGAKLGELRIQRWGERLRHPPGPLPPDGDLESEPDYVVAKGTGTVYSYVVHHHPAVPGKRLPFVVALVELEEGVRVLGELLDTDPDEVHIGLEVEASFVRVDDELTLPAWKVRR